MLKWQLRFEVALTTNNNTTGPALRDEECIPGLRIEADAPLSASRDWIVPLALLEAMMAERPLTVDGPVSPRLAGRLGDIQDLYCSWLPAAGKTPVAISRLSAMNPAPGTSVFFSGGVDSFYSLLKRLDNIDNLILVHGFDTFLADETSFEPAWSAAREIATMFGKRLITVRTNLRNVSHPVSWGIHHGAALAAVAHALQPNHSAVYVGSTHPYRDLHIWGSHPLLDPWWSSEAVEIVHDGAETDRVGKLRLICQSPRVIPHLRVCWQNTGAYNCGVCEKCLRTMVALQGLGALERAAFPARCVDPALVRRLALDGDLVFYWRELLELDLPAGLRSAVRRVIADHEWGLPPGGRIELCRLRAGASQLRRLGRALFS